MTDIVEKLRDYANDDHERLCQGRTYSCSCGYDDKRDPLMTEAADLITALRAEVERLRAALAEIDSISVHSGGDIHGVHPSFWEVAFKQAQDVARAAITQGEHQ